MAAYTPEDLDQILGPVQPIRRRIDTGLDDENEILDSALSAADRASQPEEPGLFRKALHVATLPFAAPQMARDWLGRKVAGGLGLPVGDETTLGQMARSAAGLDAQSLVAERRDSVPRRLLGRTIELGADIGPELPLPLGLTGKAAKVALGALSAQAGIGAVEEGQKAYQTIKREGFTPQAAEEVFGTAIQTAMAVGAGAHALTPEAPVAQPGAATTPPPSTAVAPLRARAAQPEVIEPEVLPWREFRPGRVVGPPPPQAPIDVEAVEVRRPALPQPALPPGPPPVSPTLSAAAEVAERAGMPGQAQRLLRAMDPLPEPPPPPEPPQPPPGGMGRIDGTEVAIPPQGEPPVARQALPEAPPSLEQAALAGRPVAEPPPPVEAPQVAPMARVQGEAPLVPEVPAGAPLRRVEAPPPAVEMPAGRLGRRIDAPPPAVELPPPTEEGTAIARARIEQELGTPPPDAAARPAPPRQRQDPRLRAAMEDIATLPDDGRPEFYNPDGSRRSVPELQTLEREGRVPRGTVQRFEDWWAETGGLDRAGKRVGGVDTEGTSAGTALEVNYKGRPATRAELLEGGPAVRRRIKDQIEADEAEQLKEYLGTATMSDVLRNAEPTGASGYGEVYREGTQSGLRTLFDQHAAASPPREIARGVRAVDVPNGGTILRSGDAFAQITDRSVDVAGPPNSLASGRLMRHLFREFVAGRVRPDVPMTDDTLRVLAGELQRQGVSMEQVVGLDMPGIAAMLRKKGINDAPTRSGGAGTPAPDTGRRVRGRVPASRGRRPDDALAARAGATPGDAGPGGDPGRTRGRGRPQPSPEAPAPSPRGRGRAARAGQPPAGVAEPERQYGELASIQEPPGRPVRGEVIQAGRVREKGVLLYPETNIYAPQAAVGRALVHVGGEDFVEVGIWTNPDGTPHFNVAGDAGKRSEGEILAIKAKARRAFNQAIEGQRRLPKRKGPRTEALRRIMESAHDQIQARDAAPKAERGPIVDVGSPRNEYKAPATRAQATRAATAAARQLSMDFARGAGEAVQSVSGGRGLRGIDAGSGVRTVGLSITLPRALEARGWIDLRGHRVEKPQDLAVLARVYRDPRYETFRLFYTKGGEVVAHEGMTSRIPDQARALSMRPEKDIHEIRDRMRRTGADGFWMLHNHPSGTPSASRLDKKLTERFAAAIPGFKGHVIIDGSQFGHIAPDTFDATLGDLPPEVAADEPYFKASQGDAVGTIGTQYELAQVGAKLRDGAPDDYVTLIHVDAQQNVRAVQEMPTSLFENVDEAEAYIRGRQRAFGTGETFAYHPSGTHVRRAAQELIFRSALRDAVYDKRTTTLTQQGAQQVIPGPPAKAIRVGEEREGYKPELTAFHNLTAEELKKIDKLGGFPMPSIAITRGKVHEGYGDIALVGDRNMIDPERTPENKVYPADAYTGRFPETEFKPKKGQADKLLETVPRKEFHEVGDEGFDLLRKSPDRALEYARRSLSMQAAFLREQGKKAEAVTRAKPLRYPFSSDTELRAWAEGKWAKGDRLFEMRPGEPGWKEFTEKVKGAIERYEPGDDAELRGEIRDIHLRNVIDDDTGELSFGRAARIIDDLQAQHENKPEMDRYATQEALEKGLAELPHGSYEEWARRKIAPLFDGEFIRLGRKRVPVTLDSVMEAMRRVGSMQAKEKNMTYGPGQARAAGIRPIRDVQQMRNQRESIVGDKAFKEWKDKNKDLQTEMQDALGPLFDGDTWGGLDSMYRAVGATLKSLDWTASRLGRELRKVGFSNIGGEALRKGEAVVKSIGNAPTEYFEAKPERAVALKEFRGAVVPVGTSPDVIHILEKHGIPVHTYDSFEAGERQAAVDRILAESPDAVFEERRGYKADSPREQNLRRWFGESKVVDESGKPKQVYHGTGSPGFDAFDTAKQDATALYGPGFYFTEDPTVAGGDAGKIHDAVYADSKAEAEQMQLDHYKGKLPWDAGSVWHDVALNKWAAPIRKVGFTKRGYAHKGAVVEPKAAAEAIYDSPELTRLLSKYGGIARFERERLMETIEKVRNASSPDGARTLLSFLEAQPYNLDVGKILERTGQEQVGAVYPTHLKIERPFDIDRKYSRDEAAGIYEQAVKMLEGATEKNLERRIQGFIREGDSREVATRKAGFMSDNEGQRARGHAADLLDARRDGARQDSYSGDDIYRGLYDIFYNTKLGERRADGPKAAVTKALQVMGYDGITHTGGGIMGGAPHKVWIAFEPNQIKSSTGNRGTFDAADPRLVAAERKGYQYERTKQGEQGMVPGMLDAAARGPRRPTEGREAQGPLFTQEKDAAERATVEREAKAQMGLFDGDAALERLKKGPGNGKLFDLGGAAGAGAGVMRDLGIYGASVVERMAKDLGGKVPEFGAWAKAFVSEMGNSVKGLGAHLRDLYARAVALFRSKSGQAPPSAATFTQPAGTTARRGAATPPPGRPAGGQGAAPGQRPANFTFTDETTGEAVSRVFQDYMRRVRTIRDAVKAQGGNVAHDPVLADELRSGRVASRVEDIHERFAKPLAEQLGKDGLNLGQLDDYLKAADAASRNAVLHGRAGVVDGSGWSDAKAAQVMADFKAKGLEPKLKAAAQRVYDALEEGLKIAEQEGLLSKTQVQELKNTWGKTYVPWKSGEAEAGHGGHGFGGKGYDVTGKEYKQAHGRSSEAFSPTSHAFAQLERTISRAERNRVTREFAEFVKDNPDPKAWRLDVDHKHRDGTQDHAAYEDDVRYRVNGKQHRITVEDPLLRRAMKNLGAVEGNRLTDAIAKATRTYSKLVTTYSPEFLFTNLAKDLQDAAINLSAERGADVAKKVVKGVAQSIRAMYRVTKDPNAKGKYEDYAREFKKNGGPLGWATTKSAEQLHSDLTREISSAGPGPLNQAKRALGSIGKFVHDANGAVENGTRLSTYIALREAGFSEAESIRGAKGVTINFEKHGEAGPLLNSLYAFFNANVQGTKRLKEVVIDNPRGRKIAAGIMAAGAALDAINRAQAGDSDDDGTNDYDAIPEYVKARNLVVMTGDGRKPILFPLPYGFGLIMSAGRLGMATSAGAVTPARAAATLGSAAINAFNPLGSELASEKGFSGAGIVQAMSPTVLDPFVQHATNRDWRGQSIKPEGFPGQPEKPASEQYWKNVSPTAKSVARWLNEKSGGDKVTPGYVSVSPETMEHYLAFAGGGAGRFLLGAKDVAGSLAEGKLPSVRNTPFVRRFVYDKSPGLTGTRYREGLADLERLELRAKTYRQEGDMDKLRDIPVERLRAKRDIDYIDRQIRSLRRAGKAIPEERLNKQIEELQNKALKIMARAEAG